MSKDEQLISQRNHLFIRCALKLEEAFGPQDEEWLQNTIYTAVEELVRNCSQEPQEPL